LITLEPKVPYDEQALLMQLQAGSADAFTQLYQAYAERLYYNILALVKDGLTAEELVQDVFSRIWQKREAIQIDTSFAAYLFTASRNRVYDFFRKLDRDHHLYATIKSAATYEYSYIEEALLDRENADILQKAIKSLPQQRRRAIDFGCGVGRLTRALHNYFPECCGIDISRGMLEKARNLAPECEFREANNLGSFPDKYADLIYSSLVLQHQPDKKHVKALIEDMMRVLAPGGLLVFQMPLHLRWRNRLQLRRRAYRLVRALGLPHTFAYERLKVRH